ncbi:nucleotidyltransferase domain-containing protein [Pseudalkalibacillus sp. Hm43]|uniref:nucleotidyltransferase domain-containing protein n=1 Tax=Pseudalkalibacillus sp. Hm43 TaxID=3450742 RepID=UPI003F437E0F
MDRLSPLETAQKLIDTHYSNCQGALLAGSVVRGEATPSSDLDVVIFDDSILASYRRSFIFQGWPVEIFVHNLSSYQQYFQSDCDRGTPSMPRMVAEGVVIQDKGVLQAIKAEAKGLLEKGPTPWSQETINMKRYFITDLLDDLIGRPDRFEQIFIVNTLADRLQEFLLWTNGRWVGSSKWSYRALKHYDKGFANTFMNAFDQYYKTNDDSKIIDLADTILEPHGGRLFDGFQLGKTEKKRER